MQRYIMISAVGAMLAGCATAQDEVPAPQATTPTPPPTCEAEGYHAFDFWLGNWDVTGPNGQFAGNNVITREEGGCLLLETWTSASGTTGQSYNYYNPDTEKWRQVWVSAGALIDYEGGLIDGGSMYLEGTITYQANAQSFPFTGEWTLNPDGTVTQHFEQYNPEQEEWVVWFTGLYTRSTEVEAVSKAPN